MKAEELMIGNRVIVNKEISYGIYSIQFDYDEGAWYVDGIHITLIEPIPLTVEWLLKFGFVSDGYGEYEKGDILLDNEYTDEGVFNIMYEHYPLGIDVLYVHQLQNLYFALTSEELTIKTK